MVCRNQMFSDKELIENYLLGDESCVEVLIRRHQNKVFLYIYKIVKNKSLADDLFQDTFIKIINILKSGNYKEQGKFINWVFRIAHNIVIDFYRNADKTIMSNFSDNIEKLNAISDFSLNVEEKILTEQLQKDIYHLIKKLPKNQKEIIYLRHYEGLTFKEIAEQTNTNLATAISRMRYALINLRKNAQKNKITFSK